MHIAHPQYKMLLGVALSLVFILIPSALFARKAKGGSRLSSSLVTGLVLGTVVGGSSTIGTAQLAYQYGCSALCFHIGGALGFILLSCLFGRKLKIGGNQTVVGILRHAYGERTGYLVSLLNCLGTFIAVISQILAASAVVTLFLGDLSANLIYWLCAALMLLYVAFGGTKGTGFAGILKLVLLTISMLICAGCVYWVSGGFTGLEALATDFKALTGLSFFSFAGRGYGRSLSDIFSVSVGIVCTQIYIQAFVMGNSRKESRRGFLVSSIVMPVIGILGTLVGLYMRVKMPDIDPKLALPAFVMNYLPTTGAGFILGTLLITVVGSGAGLVLGISTILIKDVIADRLGYLSSISHRLQEIVLLALILGAATLFCILSTDQTILNYSVLSMALRAAVVLAPLSFALFFSQPICERFVIAAIVLAPSIAIGFQYSGFSIVHPLLDGIILGFLLMFFGIRKSVRPLNAQQMS